MHGLETLKKLNTRAAIKGVVRRNAEAKRAIHDASVDRAADQDMADDAARALEGDESAWEATVARLAERGL